MEPSCLVFIDAALTLISVSLSIRSIQEDFTSATLAVSVIELSSINFLQSLCLQTSVTHTFHHSEKHDECQMLPAIFVQLALRLISINNFVVFVYEDIRCSSLGGVLALQILSSVISGPWHVLFLDASTHCQTFDEMRYEQNTCLEKASTLALPGREEHNEDQVKLCGGHAPARG